MDDFPDDIFTYIKNITTRHPAIKSIWLVGSRANPGNSPPNDWDFIAFATREVLLTLRSSNCFMRPDIDLLVVTDGDSFESPWPLADHPNRFKGGRLHNYVDHSGTEVITWEWKPLSDSETEARYTAPGDRNGRPIYKKAFRIYPV